MLFLHWGYASIYAFHLLLLYENQSYLSMLSYIKREAWAIEKNERD